jgi:type I restriction enzyme, S subunit
MALTVSLDDIVASGNSLLAIKPHWQRVRLGDVGQVLNGYAFKAELFTRECGMPLIRIRDVGSAASETFYSGDYDERYVVNAGDLLVGMDGDFNCARWRGPRSLLNQRVCKITVDEALYLPRFLDYVLPGYLKAINDATSSITVKHLSSRTIQDIPLPLPPMDEQREIVAELEKQFSRLGDAVANLQRVKANLKRYKASVLKVAVEGRLAETEASIAHREGRTYETGEQLLQRILEERRVKWAGRGKYKEPVAPDEEGLHTLPEGWVWCACDQISEKITDGEHISPNTVAHGVPLLSAKDVLDTGVTFDDAKFVAAVDSEKFRSRCNPDRGDVLIVSRGATIGRACLVNSDRKFCLMGSVILMKPHAGVNSAYLLQALKAGFFQTRLTAVSGSTAQQAIYIRDIRPLQMPLPPQAEQARIVAEVDRHLSIVREVEAEVDANLRRAQALRQATLARVFATPTQQ